MSSSSLTGLQNSPMSDDTGEPGRSTPLTSYALLMATVPYKNHTILTDNGIQFTHRKQDRFAFEHLFERRCKDYGIKHRLSTVNHPWSNGQVERMKRKPLRKRQSNVITTTTTPNSRHILKTSLALTMTPDA